MRVSGHPKSSAASHISPARLLFLSSITITRPCRQWNNRTLKKRASSLHTMYHRVHQPSTHSNSSTEKRAQYPHSSPAFSTVFTKTGPSSHPFPLFPFPSFLSLRTRLTHPPRNVQASSTYTTCNGMDSPGKAGQFPPATASPSIFR